MIFFFFNDTATTEIYTLSLHDALPIFSAVIGTQLPGPGAIYLSQSLKFVKPVKSGDRITARVEVDRKSTRLNSSHLVISYAVFCLKKKKRHHSKQIAYCINRVMVDILL